MSARYAEIDPVTKEVANIILCRPKQLPVDGVERVRLADDVEVKTNRKDKWNSGSRTFTPRVVPPRPIPARVAQAAALAQLRGPAAYIADKATRDAVYGILDALGAK